MRATLVDISRYQKQVDGSAIKAAGFDGIIARCTIGWSYLDPFYIHNFRTARENELVFISYHVLWPWNRDPERELDWAMENCEVDGEKPDGATGDYERPNTTQGWGQVSEDEVARQIRIHLPGLEQRMQRRATAYSGTWWWGASGHLSVFPVGVENRFGWHEAEYFAHPPAGQWYDPNDAPMTGNPNSIARGWDDWSFWQWTSRGRPIGAPDASNMDYNVFNGDLNALKAYLNLEQPPPPSGARSCSDRSQSSSGQSSCYRDRNLTVENLLRTRSDNA